VLDLLEGQYKPETCLPPTYIEARQTMSNPRAVRYRRLTLTEQDREKADLLYKIADEADRGVLVTADWMTAARHSRRKPSRVR
jgi:hypothetical protein